jgi:hypothetical protein
MPTRLAEDTLAGDLEQIAIDRVFGYDPSSLDHALRSFVYRENLHWTYRRLVCTMITQVILLTRLRSLDLRDRCSWIFGRENRLIVLDAFEAGYGWLDINRQAPARSHPDMFTRLIVLGAATAALCLPAAASAHTGDFANFNQWPSHTSGVMHCLYSVTNSGKIILGKKTTPIVNKVTLQGGYSEENRVLASAISQPMTSSASNTDLRTNGRLPLPASNFAVPVCPLSGRSHTNEAQLVSHSSKLPIQPIRRPAAAGFFGCASGGGSRRDGRCVATARSANRTAAPTGNKERVLASGGPPRTARGDHCSHHFSRSSCR